MGRDRRGHRIPAAKAAIPQQGGNGRVAEGGGHVVVRPDVHVTLPARGGIEGIGVLNKVRIVWGLL